jgi:hypothetical protein
VVNKVVKQAIKSSLVRRTFDWIELSPDEQEKRKFVWLMAGYGCGGAYVGGTPNPLEILHTVEDAVQTCPRSAGMSAFLKAQLLPQRMQEELAQRREEERQREEKDASDEKWDTIGVRRIYGHFAALIQAMHISQPASICPALEEALHAAAENHPEGKKHGPFFHSFAQLLKALRNHQRNAKSKEKLGKAQLELCLLEWISEEAESYEGEVTRKLEEMEYVKELVETWMEKHPKEVEEVVRAGIEVENSEEDGRSSSLSSSSRRRVVEAELAEVDAKRRRHSDDLLQKNRKLEQALLEMEAARDRAEEEKEALTETYDVRLLAVKTRLHQAERIGKRLEKEKKRLVESHERVVAARDEEIDGLKEKLAIFEDDLECAPPKRRRSN